MKDKLQTIKTDIKKNIFFSNAKWIKISLESLMIELCLYIKIYLDYFPERPEICETWKMNASYILSSSLKSC